MVRQAHHDNLARIHKAWGISEIFCYILKQKHIYVMRQVITIRRIVSKVPAIKSYENHLIFLKERVQYIDSSLNRGSPALF
jgi:hypothetical protein